ncbi:hypothetical protein [Paenibacillus aceti]|uniref:Multi-tm2 domain protein n=1 Tax=Paenibacillus aceti TaxID=1820010 RepID=A0ABQ1W3M8_9BACL|nr:hypothetical protein [Paenibacillus aceti]GGG11976.1 hypothetical protein GCM10010913_37250 [Paenibacillus aceti]
MTQYRNRLLALILNLIPGLGHLYWGKKVRGVLYPMFFFGGILFGFLLSVASSDEVFLGITVVAAFILWCISMLDLIIVLLREPTQVYPSVQQQAPPIDPLDPLGIMPPPMSKKDQDRERFYIILLSFVPGLGHFQMGLMQRGLSFLISFFGLFTMLLFVTGITHESVFLLFLGLLPIIWLYSMFDAVGLVHRKQAGMSIQDRTLFDEWESGRGEGRRSKVLATLLSAFPGAGQMYLGLQKRGLQLMVMFLGSFYIIDVLRLKVFLFIIPIIWFFSLFDGLQQISRYGILPLEDRPLIDGKRNYQHWLGIILIVLGIYYVSMDLLVPMVERYFPGIKLTYFIHHYLRPVLIAFLLIGGGLKLVNGTRNKSTL